MIKSCIIKTWYAKATPYLQLGGYLVMMGTLLTGLWMVYSFIAQVNANAATIVEYQAFKDTTQIELARIEQKVDDIHDAVIYGKRKK